MDRSTGGRQNLPKLLVGTLCRDFDAVPMIFDFFAGHRRVRARGASAAPKPPSGTPPK